MTALVPPGGWVWLAAPLLLLWGVVAVRTRRGPTADQVELGRALRQPQPIPGTEERT